MRVTCCPLLSFGARSETVPGFNNVGGVHDPTTSVSFLTTRGACTPCASCASIDAFTVGAGVGAAIGVSLTLGAGDATGVSAVTASGGGKVEVEGSGASGSGSGDCAGLGATTSAGLFVITGEATGVDTFATAPVASCCALKFCCVFALTLTNEIVIPSTGIAIAAPTAPRMILGCFARARELMHPLTQEIPHRLQALTPSIAHHIVKPAKRLSLGKSMWVRDYIARRGPGVIFAGPQVPDAFNKYAIGTSFRPAKPCQARAPKCYS